MLWKISIFHLFPFFFQGSFPCFRALERSLSFSFVHKCYHSNMQMSNKICIIEEWVELTSQWNLQQHTNSFFLLASFDPLTTITCRAQCFHNFLYLVVSELFRSVNACNEGHFWLPFGNRVKPAGTELVKCWWQYVEFKWAIIWVLHEKKAWHWELFAVIRDNWEKSDCVVELWQPKKNENRRRRFRITNRNHEFKVNFLSLTLPTFHA